MIPVWIKHFIIGPQIIMEIAASHNLDPELVLAVVQVESSGGRRMTKYEPTFKYLHFPDDFAAKIGISHATEKNQQKTSWGPMHVMGGTARDLGYEDELPNLIYPSIGLEWGCKYLKVQFDKYGNMKEALAAYNGGSARYKNGKLEPRLQKYVNMVMGYYKDFKE
jgi:soluble lytic murein transglycosylase-like protein